ncbi:hypothetical protein LSH36_437g00015 [Paralvinella palmiformis]|uniref:MH1 domain-containing protein n=1 Tax=Paralvinella palmiformis TaxID=53620 RepID=A0AAD9JAS6_9ANNE|nr:hypothetical protein LSH36_437g00015 [Paralvinella palmiformis]
MASDVMAAAVLSLGVISSPYGVRPAHYSREKFRFGSNQVVFCQKYPFDGDSNDGRVDSERRIYLGPGASSGCPSGRPPTVPLIRNDQRRVDTVAGGSGTIIGKIVSPSASATVCGAVRGQSTVECVCDCAAGGHQDVSGSLSLDDGGGDAAPQTECPCFMFRSRRSTLVKRLWRSRISDRNEAQQREDDDTNQSAASPRIPNSAAGQESPLIQFNDDEGSSQVKAVTQAMLKRLKERHLEVLVEAVESRGGQKTDCVLLPKDNIRLGRRGVLPPHVLCCQIWRWSDLSGEQGLKKLPSCQSSTDDPLYVCCNPYHWSLRVPGEWPPADWTIVVLVIICVPEFIIGDECCWVMNIRW